MEFAAGRVFTILLMVTLMIIIYLFRKRTKLNLWYSLFIASVVVSQLASVIDPVQFQGIRERIVFPELIARFFSALSYWFAPYFLLLVGVELVRDSLLFRGRVIWKVLLIPIMYGLMNDLLIDPRNGFLYVYPEYSKRFIIISGWGMVCALLANALIIYATLTEKQPQLKLQKLLIVCITLPTLLVMYHTYILPLQGPCDFDDLLNWTCLLLSIMFIYFAVRYGIMGMKITIEKDAFDFTMQAITSGTSVINHAIKNKLQVIDLAVATLRSPHISPGRRVELLDIISSSSEHLRGMVNSIHQKTTKLVLDMQLNDLAGVMNETLDCIKPLLESRRIDLVCQLEPVTVCCDRVHLREVFANIVRNSIEAITEGGRIDCRVFQLNQWAIIEIQDNGPGIPDEYLNKIYDPFFTTKKSEENFGLGLSYCYNVILRHRGLLTIKSNAHGTTVVITLQLAGA